MPSGAKKLQQQKKMQKTKNKRPGIPFPIEVQQAHRQIKAWTMVKRYVSGMKVSSHFLSHTLKKRDLLQRQRNCQLPRLRTL
jgi:hypothetical protein